MFHLFFVVGVACFGIVAHYSVQVIDASKSVDSSGRKCRGCSGLGNVCSGSFFQQTSASTSSLCFWILLHFCTIKRLVLIIDYSNLEIPFASFSNETCSGHTTYTPVPDQSLHGFQSSLRYFAYGPQTANLAEVFMSMMVAQLVSLKTGEWHKIWKAKPLNLGQPNCA